MNNDQLEMLWRESAWEFLAACFSGASPDVIKMLAEAMFAQRQAARAAGISLPAVARTAVAA
jgi:hypothetical protein